MSRIEQLRQPISPWGRRAAAEWQALPAPIQTVAKVLVLLGATALAFHYTLTSLLRTASLDTPLAATAVVPVLALALAWANRRARRSELDIHDRQLDWSIGLPLVLVPLLVGWILPGRMGAVYWLDRLDLAILPLFVAGATVLLFGVRAAWRQRPALLYLWLAWPWPYTQGLLGLMSAFRAITVAALRAILHVAAVATPVAGSAGGGSFDVHAAHPFTITVVNACAGIDGAVGFLVIGLALAAVARGPRLRKALWFASGLVVFWATNVLRLVILLWVGSTWGRHLALDVVHPWLGVATFTVGSLLVIVAMRPFGLDLRAEPGDRAAPVAPPAGPTLVAPVAGLGGWSRVRLGRAVVSVLVVGVVLGITNTNLVAFDPVAAASGEARLSSFLADPAAPAGWRPTYLTEYSSNRSLFGSSSRWFRYLYVPADHDRGHLHSTLPVTADVIDAGGLAGFRAYGVTACYSFHGYHLRDVAAVDLGDGIRGQALSYAGGSSHQDWSIVYWIWPVRVGATTRYERVILYLQDTAHATVEVRGRSALAESSRAARRQGDGPTARLAANRAFLVAFARDLVARQRHQPATEVAIAAVQPHDAVWTAWSAQALGRRRATAGRGAALDPTSAHDRFWLDYERRHPQPATASSAPAGAPASSTAVTTPAVAPATNPSASAVASGGT